MQCETSSFEYDGFAESGSMNQSVRSQALEKEQVRCAHFRPTDQRHQLQTRLFQRVRLHPKHHDFFQEDFRLPNGVRGGR